ncbi:hypothetical protein V6N11_051168 [Hibiscus sabdariffa]|uniref:Uncharacterized protein n=1 Tax=Hibiscus sabdariffa TaxID=183260 RepID=A0ABR2R3H8_9ROSI
MKEIQRESLWIQPSSKFSTTQVWSINGRIPQSRAYVSEGYASSVPSRINVRSTTKKDLNFRQLQHEKFSDDDVPSAPPFSSSVKEDKQDSQHIPMIEIQTTSSAADSLDPKMLKGALSFSSVTVSLQGIDELLE